jgi:hypothetical protein
MGRSSLLICLLVKADVKPEISEDGHGVSLSVFITCRSPDGARPSPHRLFIAKILRAEADLMAIR